MAKTWSSPSKPSALIEADAKKEKNTYVRLALRFASHSDFFELTAAM